VLGDDLFGQIILKGLRGEGVDTADVQISASGPTALMVKNRRAGGEPVVFYYRRNSAMSLASVATLPRATWGDAQVLYLSGITPALSDSCRAMVKEMVAQAHAAGIEVWFDPNHRRKLWSDEDARRTIMELLPKMAMVLVGTSEAKMLTGLDEPSSIARVILDAGARQVIVKAGAAGTFYDDGHEQIHTPAFPLERVIDPIGAGDGFAAGVISARLEGLSWREAMRRGNAVGAMVCLTQGDWEGLPTKRELDDFLAKRAEAVR
jgi:2-dehydro-3-deoxygluconokinase